jgi:hypothetical protein
MSADPTDGGREACPGYRTESDASGGPYDPELVGTWTVTANERFPSAATTTGTAGEYVANEYGGDTEKVWITWELLRS